MKPWFITLAIATSTNVQFAKANDTMAQVTPAGIQFVKSADVSMVSEELKITPKKISVSYVFKNDSDKDIEGEVTFPIPEVPFLSPSNFNPEKENGNISTNPANFKLTVDGIPTHFASDFDVKNVMFKDQSEKDTIHFSISDTQTQPYVQIQNYEMAGAGIYNFHWKQKFPAHKEVKIEHEYSAAGSSGKFHEQPVEGGKYCFDKSFIMAFNKLKKASIKRRKYTENNFFEAQLHYLDNNISYILKTANNWKGPIKHFRLIIEKENSDQLMQTCFEGLKKISALRFESEETSYSPKNDLEIVFFDFDRELKEK